MSRRSGFTFILGACLLLRAMSLFTGATEKPASVNSTPLRRALDAYCEKLNADGHGKFANLLSEELIRTTIKAALEKHQVLLEKVEPNPANAKYFSTVKPVYLSIADQGAWPENCSFSDFFGLGTRLGLSDGYWLRIRVDTPGEPGGYAYALPIIDLGYGLTH